MAYATTPELKSFQFQSGDILEAWNGQSGMPVSRTSLYQLLIVHCKLNGRSVLQAEHLQTLLDRGYIQVDSVKHVGGMRKVSISTGRAK